MPKFRLKLDHDGIAELLKGAEVRAMVDNAAAQIAARVQSEVGDAEVETGSYTTDRAAASVTILDIKGMKWQAEDGVLSRAALGIGAEFKGR